MKVLLFNGSPHREGSTFVCLSEVAKALNEDGIETEIIDVGSCDVVGCKACGFCSKTGKCQVDDIVNIAAEKVKTADGFVFSSPVYFASANGTMVSFMDRLFMVAKKYMAYKPGVSVTVARRAGTTCTYDLLNKYIGIANMLQVPANYWNMAYGHNAEETREDEEGMRIMRTIGHNMAWLLKVLDNAKKSGIEHP